MEEGRFRRVRERLCRVQVNSEQVSLESLSEADEQLCGPDIVLDLFFVFQGSALFSIMGHLRLLTVLNKYTTNPTMTITVK